MSYQIINKLKECFECGTNEKIVEHHVVPFSKGGTKTIPLCENCHGKVHGRQMNVKELTSLGIQKLKKQNKRYTRHPPYGYSFNGDDMVVNEEEQKIINIMQNMRDDKKKLREIADRLNNDNIFKRNGTRWDEPRISRTLNATGSSDVISSHEDIR